MSLVAGSSLSLAYGPKVLLDEESFAIGPHDRIGLVGANGTGKSSLMRILAGQLSADSGELVFRRGARVGYLPQDVAALPDLPLVDAVLATVPGRARAREPAPRRRGRARRGHGAGGSARAVRRPRRAARVAGSLRGALRPPPRRADPGRPRLHRGRSRAPGAHVLRGLEDARRARGAPPPGSGSAPPRRADEPPRRPDPRVVRRVPARDAARAAPRLPRPRVPEPPDRPRARARAGGAALVHRRLRGLQAPACDRGGAAPRRGEAAGREARAARGVHRALRREGHEGPAGEVEGEAAREDGGGAGPRAPRDGPLPLRGGAALGPRGAPARGRAEGVRAARGLPSARRDRPARRAGRRHRRERRGQVDAPQARRRRAGGGRRRGEARARGPRRLLRPASF